MCSRKMFSCVFPLCRAAATILAAVAVVLCGCTSSEESEDRAGEVVMYVAEIPWIDETLTRADVLGEKSELDGTVGFGLYAFLTQGDYAGGVKPNVMANEQVKYSGDRWTYSPMKLWPATDDQRVSLMAYAPYGNTSITASDNAVEDHPYVDFTTELSDGTTPDAASQTDLMAASELNLKRSEASSDEGKRVELKFSHALSKVTLKEVDISDLSLTAIAFDRLEMKARFAKKGRLMLNDKTWNLTGEGCVPEEGSEWTLKPEKDKPFFLIPQDNVEVELSFFFTSSATNVIETKVTKTLSFKSGTAYELKFKASEKTNFEVEIKSESPAP